MRPAAWATGAAKVERKTDCSASSRTFVVGASGGLGERCVLALIRRRDLSQLTLNKQAARRLSAQFRKCCLLARADIAGRRINFRFR
jgi:NAD(P)-dependent dehydrogenase (short-subunit alcohol dehydrogenase family)